MKKELLFVITTMLRGGAERVTSIIANELVSRGWKVHLLIWKAHEINYPLSPDIDVIDISGIKAPFGLPDRVRYKFPLLVSGIRDVIGQIQPDAVISMLVESNIIVHKAMSRGSIKSVRRIASERIDPRTLSRLIHFQAERAYRSASACVMQTETARHSFSRKVQERTVIIPNPSEVKIYASKHKRPRIVTAGRLEPQKNHMLLIDAFSDMHRTHPEYTLDIYGSGSLRNTLQEHINSLGLSDAVKLCGEVPDIHERIADAGVFVMSSDYEGMSNALIEAMIMGLPCISTDTAGADEIISDGISGLIVPVGNREKLAGAMMKLADNKEFAESLGNEAGKCAGKFSISAVTDQWEELILKVIQERAE